MYIRACICNFSIFFFLIFISSRSKVEIFSFTYKITTKRNVFFERDRFLETVHRRAEIDEI